MKDENFISINIKLKTERAWENGRADSIVLYILFFYESINNIFNKIENGRTGYTIYMHVYLYICIYMHN